MLHHLVARGVHRVTVHVCLVAAGVGSHVLSRMAGVVPRSNAGGELLI